jgi:hypothetical protein
VVGCGLAGLAAFLALVSESAFPARTSWSWERDGVIIAGGSSYHPWMAVLAMIQVVAMVAALVGLGLAAGRRDTAAGRSLLVAGVAGLVPTVVPGVVALLARWFVRRAGR